MQQIFKMDTVCFLANCKSIVICMPNFMPKTEQY
jgi:hypothetical protein